MNFRGLGLFLLMILLEPSNGRQFCGSDLANVMRLVCQGRGYNVAFSSPDYSPRERRFKRGIVDECCRRGCSWSTLETYCASAPENVQIRKRSDFPSLWAGDSSSEELSHETPKYETISEETISLGNDKSFYPKRIYALRDEGNRHSQLPRVHSAVNKVKRNDIEDAQTKTDRRAAHISFPIDWRSAKIETGKQGSTKGEIASASLPIRHRHRKSKPAKEGSSSQVGTIPPYFLGRTLVFPPSRQI